MTPKQQADKINAFIANWDNLVADTFFLAITKLDEKMHTRIFNEHKTATGASLGQYSTKPMLVGAKSFVGKSFANTFFSSVKGAEKKAKGEGFNSNWKTVKVGKSKSKNAHLYLLLGGYKELRAIQGRDVGEVNLQYSFELAKDGTEVVVNGEDYLIKFKNQKSIDKGRGFEERKGLKVFSPSKDESNEAFEFIGNRIITELKDLFGNV